MKPEIQVRLCNQQDKRQWDSFIAGHPCGNFYMLYDWSTINAAHFGHQTYFIGAFRDDKLIGTLPVVYIKSILFGKVLSSMPFLNYGGICAEDPHTTALLIQKIKSIADELNVNYVEIRSVDQLDEQLHTATHKVSMTLDLADDAEVLWNNFTSKHRTNIRRVYKNGIDVRHGKDELLDDFYHVLSHSWRDLGTPIYKKQFFRDILTYFSPFVRIFVAYKDGKPIATAFNANYNGTVEGMWAGVLQEYKRLQPNYVLYWEMIKNACEDSLEKFHLGRSTIASGAEHFKSKWNAYQTQLYWQYYLVRNTEIPQLNVDNPKYKYFINLWRKLPVGVANVIGPPLAKNIP